MPRLRTLAEAVRTNFFLLPAIAVVAGFVGARLAVGVDVGAWVGEATVDSARTVLSTVAAATITFASITFSVSLLIMQQGSSQFSPRVIPGLTRDPFNRRVIAIVVGTFTYCLIVLQRVRAPISESGEAVVPSFAVALGVVLGISAVLAVVAAIHHTARQMDVSKILGGIVSEAARAPLLTTDGWHPTDAAEPPLGVPSSSVRFQESGWVQQVDVQALGGVVEPGGTLRLETAPGQYAIVGTVAATVWPAIGHDSLESVRDRVGSAITLGSTRTMVQDLGYGVRQLVDVALKVLSPGINDPTTAQDAIVHLGDLLVTRLTSPLFAAAYGGDQRRRVLIPNALTDEALARLALAELRLAAANQPTVCLYLLEMIADVARAVEASEASDRAAPLRDQAALLLIDARHAGLAAHSYESIRTAYAERFGEPPSPAER